MSLSFGAGVRDSLSNLAASLGTGRDKAAHDAFTVVELGRTQVEAMYRGDWLARKVVDIVPYDSVRAWRSWSGHRADVARFEAAERRLGLRKTVQRAMTLGRLYGGGAVLIGDGEGDVAALARPLDPRLPRDGLAYLHAVSRWQLGVSEIDLNPLSPWCGEPKSYTLSSPGRPALELHPSRVVRFLGNPLPDPSVAGALWSDSVLQSLYDAVHAAALSLAGATSLLHEAKVDVVTVPNLSEHLSSAETTEQLSARFAYAAAMKSTNNLLLLGDGESWSRQTVDFAGIPEMARTFLQVAAGAADIPVTRLLGQSPSGLSATGESDVRNYYDMIAARQELDLRPQLERLDRLICWSEGIDEGALSFAFRPLWQLDEPAKAALVLSRAQATQIYAGLKLWPDAVMAQLAEAQLVQDGTYPNAAAVFAEQAGEVVKDAREVGAVPHVGGSWPGEEEPRDWHGRWARVAGTAPRVQGVQVAQAGEDPIAGGDPDIDEHLRRMLEEQERLPHIGPALIPKEKPDGTIERADPSGIFFAAPQVSKATPAATSVTPSTPAQPLPSPRLAGAGSMELARSIPVRPWPLTPQGGASPSFNERADEPPTPGTYRASKALASIKIPGNLSLEARGQNAKEQGEYYENEVRKALNFDAATPPPGVKYKKGDSAPDGIFTDSETGQKIALEVKYFNKNKSGVHDPDNMLIFMADKDVNQARKYLDAFEGGLLWIVNDRELVYRYDYFFRRNGFSGFRIEYIESR